eukprot:TRINITY_DN61788_c0_g1_i1.p1 TRINITY_DN61788_c0_g1~~TRINITY_DN61788_c0_g1_i1.p1  ORF type:complete len:359 (-),score=65.19 TRINITY_DN61788_c0_g1_i1:535-1611(-)
MAQKTFHATALRVKDPKRSIPFYQTNFGVTLIHIYHFPSVKQSHYFLASMPPTLVAPSELSSKESETFLLSFPGTTLQLIHNWGTETDPNWRANDGNQDPLRGFGHIAFNTPDVYAACDGLQANGVKFRKLPNEGRMKGLAFALDPDGYWIEVVKGIPMPGVGFNLSQTMLRVKDKARSVEFYQKLLGAEVVYERDFPDAKFSLTFLASPQHKPGGAADPLKDVMPPPAQVAQAALAPALSPTTTAALDAAADGGDGDVDLGVPKRMFWPCLELTWNYGTEADPAFHYHDGSTVPEGHDAATAKGFAGLTFLVPDPAALGAAPLVVDGLSMVGLRDPDGYVVRLVGPGQSLLGIHEDV